MTYALCGFANFGSLGIMIGGMGAMAPERRGDIVALGLRSILSGTFATCERRNRGNVDLGAKCNAWCWCRVLWRRLAPGPQEAESRCWKLLNNRTQLTEQPTRLYRPWLLPAGGWRHAGRWHILEHKVTLVDRDRQ